MFTLSTLIGVGTLALLIGFILGAVLARTLSPQQQQARSLEVKLQNSEKQLLQYQQEVTTHFAQTAQLVNTLTQSYRDVHEHLAKDALKFANVDISRQLLKNASLENDAVISTPEINEGNFHPPRDWAPKSPGSEGTLSENYGLHENEDYEIGDEVYSRDDASKQARKKTD